MIIIAIGCAAAAACCFAGAATLQHGAIRASGCGESLGLRALGRVIQSRRWLAGAGLAVTGSGLHATALSQAPLVIVQPIGVLSLVLTVVLGARVRGVAVTPGVRAAVTCVCAGTGGFVVLAALAGMAPTDGVRAGPVAIVIVGALTLTAFGLTLRGRARCLVLSAAAAVLFGTGSAVIRTASLTIISSGAGGVGLALIAALLMLTGGWAQNQAYASGPPAVVIAATTVIDPLTAVAIGIGIYGEAAHISPTHAALQVAFALLAAAGVIVLARSVPDPHVTATPSPAPPTAPPAKIPAMAAAPNSAA